VSRCTVKHALLDDAGLGRLEAKTRHKELKMGLDICWLISQIVNLIQIVVLVWVVLSWLVMFNVINAHNQFVSTVLRITDGLVRPMLAPIQRFLPTLGGLDLSPIVLLIGLEFLRRILCRILISTMGV
jgi:YggT family protein